MAPDSSDPYGLTERYNLMVGLLDVVRPGDRPRSLSPVRDMTLTEWLRWPRGGCALAAPHCSQPQLSLMGDSLSATDVAGLANRDELAIRELANERGVVILPAPRTLVIANRSGFRDFVRQHLLAAPVGLVIDCTRTEYIDSSGLAILYSLAKESRRAEIGYCVACLSADLHTLLALTRIDVVLQTKDTLGEAILAASLDASPPARP